MVLGLIEVNGALVVILENADLLVGVLVFLRFFLCFCTKSERGGPHLVSPFNGFVEFILLLLLLLLECIFSSLCSILKLRETGFHKLVLPLGISGFDHLVLICLES